MTILKEGRTQEELMQILQEMDEMTSMDSFLKNEDKVIIDCEREESRLKNWKIRYSRDSSKKPFSTGSTYRRFMDQLNKMEVEMNTEESMFKSSSCSVLCYLSTEVHRHWDGKIVSYWADIDPAVPYQVKNGCLNIPTIQLILDEKEYFYMTEAGLVFYEKSKDAFYPLTKVAYQSIGKLLDSQSAFRNIDEHLLGTALVFAEKISGLNELRLICRKKTSRIKQVYSVVGKRYQLFSQKNFFEIMLNHAATTLGTYQMVSWSVSEDITKVTIAYDYPWNDYSFYLTFSTGDTNSIPYCAKLEVLYKNVTYTLLANKAKHEIDFTEKDVPKLLNGMQEKIREYKSLHQSLEEHVCRFNANWLSKVNRTLGKKRASQIPAIPSGYYVASDLWDFIISTRGTINLPDRQANEMKNLLTDVLYKMKQEWESGTSTASEMMIEIEKCSVKKAVKEKYCMEEKATA